MSFFKSVNFGWIGVCLAGLPLLLLLVQVENSTALKCYKCQTGKVAKKCDDESRGELITCIDPQHKCFKFVTTKRMAGAKDEEAHVGEARVKGCMRFRGNHTLGCHFLSQYNDVCYCDTDMCNTHDYEPAR